MDFRITEDQEALRRGMRDLLTARFGPEDLREAAAPPGPQRPPHGLDRGLWRELGKAGLFALRLPEDEGGAGAGLPEAVLVFEEAGRALLPGPLVATHLAAGTVPDAADGSRVVTALDLPQEPGAGEEPPAAAGTAPGGLVEHLDGADDVLVLGPARVRVLPPAALDADPLSSVDPLTPLHRLRARPGTGLGEGGQWRPGARRLRREAALLTAALQLGSAGRTVELAVEHARSRRQFGRPIGSFQAVQHLCAGMLVRSETARSVVYAAAVSEDEDETAAAALRADEAAVRNARDCLQVFGGMGFTWEAEVHLHLKRAWLRAEQWMTAVTAEEELAHALQRDT